MFAPRQPNAAANRPSLIDQERAMKTFATLAVAIALGAGSISIASAETAVVSKTVKYGDLDLNGPSGAKTLYNRIKAAAESLCSPVDGRLLVQHHNFTRC